MKALLISEETLKKYTLISDNLDGKYLSSAIQATQEIDLDIIIGLALRTRLEELVYSQDIYTDEFVNYYNLLNDYITPYLCWQTMSSIQIAIQYKMTNSGVIQNDDERKSHLDYKTNQNIAQQYGRYANNYAKKLKNYLCENVSLFPEYSQVMYNEQAEEVPTYGIFLGDIPSRNKF